MRTAVRQAMWHHVMLQVRSLPGCPNMPKLKCCQARDFCLWKRQPLKSLPCLAQNCKELMGKGLQRRHWHDITRILDVPGLKSSNMFKWNQGRVFALQKLEPTSECKLWLHVVPCCSHTAGATDLRVQIVAPCCSMLLPHSWSWNQLHRFDPQWSGFRRVKNVYMQLEWAFPPVRYWNRNNLRDQCAVSTRILARQTMNAVTKGSTIYT